MRKLLLCFILSAFLFAPGLSYAQGTNEPFVLASAQATTGASANSCFSFGFEVVSVFFDTTGSTAATVEIECDDGSGAWFTLTGTGLPVTTVGKTVIGLTSYACAKLRTNVTTCTSCTVTTKCNKWKSSR